MDISKIIEWACRVVRPVLLGFGFLAGLFVLDARAQTAGIVDSTFRGTVSGGQSTLRAAVVQPDGRTMIAGSFTSIGYSFPSVTRPNIARFNADSTPDATFNAGTGPNNTVDCLAIQPDSKILAGGLFTSVNGQAANYLCRFNSDGSLDAGFTTGIVTGEVVAIAVQPDGKIVVGGNFNVNGSTQGGITRLNADGTLDSTFWHEARTNGQVNSVVLQPNGSILLGGVFTTFDGGAANGIVRLTSTGLTDGSFNAGAGANGNVLCVALQTDGHILLSGPFTTINGTARGGLARLNADGSLESTTTFNPGNGPNGPIYSMALQADGKIVCGGTFTLFSGASHFGVVRLGTNGVLDGTSTFNASVVGNVYSVGLQGDGKILVGGALSVSGASGVARLVNGTATNTLTANSAQAQWMRSGTGAEVASATFEFSPDGNTWTLLGSAARISGGWQLTGLSLPASGYLRARGVTTAGAYNGASGLIEQFIAFGGASLKPVANTLPATPTVTKTGGTVSYGVVLNGDVNAFGNSTTVTFQYGLTTSYGSSLTATPSPVTGSSLTPVTATPNSQISFFQPNTTYHYRVQATSSAGTTFSSDATFTTVSNVVSLSSLGVAGATLTPPFLSSNPGYSEYDAVLPADATTATINFTPTDPNATFNVNGTALPAGTTSAVVSVAAGNNDIPIVVTAADGVTNITYFVTVTVTTQPTAATGHTDIADTYATLKASVKAMDTTASVTFQFGTDTNYGTTITGANASGGFNGLIESTVTGLVPGATYHYRVIVTNSQGTATSDDAAFTTTLTPPPGSIDNRLNASALGIYAAVPQPDGRIIAGGFFGQANGVAVKGLARFNPDGSLDPSFNATVSSVYCLALQADGRILIGGVFTQVDGTAIKYLARLNADGSLDTSFAPTLDSHVSAIAVQPDGKILVGGYFSKVGATTQKYLARLNTDGSLDTSFAPVLDLWVNGIALQDNGQVVVGGWFSTVNGATHDNIVRLNADGTTDSTFTAGTDSPVDCVVVQPNGSVVLTGWFSEVNGVTQNNVARVDVNGTLDANFNLSTDGEVYTAALQTDGKILIGGVFSNVGTTGRNHIARFNSDGTLDTTFDPDANSLVYSITPLANGEVLAAGIFSKMFGLLHQGLALLLNDPAAQTFSVPDLTQIQWMRSGTGSEINGVTFDLSNDGGATWNALGSGTRINGGWQITGLALPSSGLIRARGRVSVGQDGGSSGILEQDFSYPLAATPAPQISVQQPAGVVLTSGGSAVGFGSLLPGASATQTFTVFNAGNADLTNLAITIDGLNNTDFVVTYAPAAVLGAGESTTFAVQFIPGAPGSRNAALHVASNAASNNPFDISLTGTGLTQQQNWLLTWFGSTAATGNAADTADPDGDGVPNLLEFATGSDPTHASTMPGQLAHSGSNLVYTYQRADGAMTDGIRFIVEWSDSLSSNSWSSVGVSETILSDDGTLQQVQATLPDGGNSQRFVRLRVTH